MPEYTANGLTLRWDAADLVSSPRQGLGARVVVGARPSHRSNVVKVAYTVNGGAERLARGYRLRHAVRSGGEELFAIDLPAQPEGADLAFIPILSCSGREADPRKGRVPFTPLVPQTAIAPSAAKASAGGGIAPAHAARFVFEPEFLFRVTAPVERDENPVGETPDGLRMVFALSGGGHVDGPALTGEILHRGGDWMRIRPDGVGIAAIHALIKPVGGGVVLTEYSGVVDFGPDGYRTLAAGGGPKRAPLRFAPRYLTAEPRLLWLNRLQCFSVGEVNLERYLVEYDLYALRPKPAAEV
ncbi:DUF3237 domain-containing protein [Methylocapsa polymorpha]|uniref:DUF3237 domain-containing protein n=1 Tax=Methylocapsa polymorpha TaxID=3080828 RepID=A0ABZ0HWC5_9HYPH|nr:DUF3237 domain-containing protein [Methylocapsa sp. RX1]